MNEYEEGEEVAIETDAPADTPPAWDGAMDSLLTQPWVPEDARPHLEKHLSTHQEALKRRDFLDQVFASDDRTAELTKALETTKAELSSLREALGKTEKERDEYKGKTTTYETKEAEAAADREVERLRTAYPDLFDEAHYDAEKGWGPWNEFFKLRDEMGYPEEKAAKMARVHLPEGAAPAQQPAAAAAPSTPAPKAPAPPRAVTVPPAVAAASRSSASPSTTVNAAEANETFEQRAARMIAEEQAKQNLGRR